MSPVAQQIVRAIQGKPVPGALPADQDSEEEFVPFVPEEPGRYPTPRISREEGRRIIDELREKYPEHWS